MLSRYNHHFFAPLIYGHCGSARHAAARGKVPADCRRPNPAGKPCCQSLLFGCQAARRSGGSGGRAAVSSIGKFRLHQALKDSMILATAFSVFSFVLKEVRRKYPSPARPKPEPGVPTTPVFCSSRSKNSQAVSPPGVLSQMYGESTPPYTSNPAAARPSRMIFALFW